MTYGIDRDRALELVRRNLAAPHLVAHSLASEAVMRRLAGQLGEDPEKWGLAGLLHDLDVERHPCLAVHTHETARILEEEGVAPEIVEAIRLHNEHAHAGRRHTPFQHALAAAETVTGLIVAAALVQPERRLANVSPRSVVKRFKDKRFAAGADRAIIREYEQLGLTLEAFCTLALEAMQEIASELELG